MELKGDMIMEAKLNLQTEPIIALFDRVIDGTEDKKLSKESIDSVMPELTEIASRLEISTRQALMMSAIVNRFGDNNIEVVDIARQFDTTPLKVLSYWSEIEDMEKKKLIRIKKESKKDLSIALPGSVFDSLKSNQPITTESYVCSTPQQWFEQLNDLLNERDEEGMSHACLMAELDALMSENPDLLIVRKIHDYDITGDDLLFFLAMIDLLVQNGDNRVTKHDVENLYNNKRDFKWISRRLETGTYWLMDQGLIEHSNANGQVESNVWQLTRKAKMEFLAEIEIVENTTKVSDLRKASKIIEKALFYNASVTRQVKQLTELLQQDKFRSVQDRLEKHGMRRGFACIFYGAPGTGKTETVLQLARLTGRDIMQVDVPNLRSKWVGDTEKNIKAVFERYRAVCQSEACAPILLFNEADAVLCKRNEGATGSVDKMENAMQNIILQEMEDLEGIMIATTNLTNNLDSAFERRFLYKIEFPKPTAEESRHIWHAMLPDLSEDSTIELARHYDFSGGQIENIARKQIVNSILSGEDCVSLASVREACDHERFQKNTVRIGFY